jgi:hypothetical protein
MTNKDAEEGQIDAVSLADTEGRLRRERHPYHTPTFTCYGQLAELVQNNPRAGSDGGVADCAHR